MEVIVFSFILPNYSKQNTAEMKETNYANSVFLIILVNRSVKTMLVKTTPANMSRKFLPISTCYQLSGIKDDRRWSDGMPYLTNL